MAKVLTVAPPELWHLVASGSQASSSWAGLIREDLCWLREQHISFLALPTPVLGLSTWLQFVVDDVGRWSRRVMQVQAEQVALLRTAVFAASLDPLGDAKLASALLRRLGPVGGGTDADDDRTVAELAVLYAFECGLCDCRFQSARLLGVHRKFHHGLVSEARLFASGTLCRICQVEFHALPRLVRHLQRHHSCLSVWKDRPARSRCSRGRRGCRGSCPQSSSQRRYSVFGRLRAGLPDVGFRSARWTVTGVCCSSSVCNGTCINKRRLGTTRIVCI